MSYQKHNFEPGAVLFASQLNDMDNQIEFLSNQGSSFSDNFKEALLNCFENVAWINENGQTYYDALYDSLYPDNMWFITNTLTGCTTSNNATSILKNNSYVATITANQGYTLSGATVSITMGGNDVTNLYYSSGSINIPNVTGDLVITVTATSAVTSISAVFTQGSAIIYDTDSLNTLRQYLTVTAIYTDSTTAIVTDYTLSGALTEATSTITVSYGGKTTTFNVAVTVAVFSYESSSGKLLSEMDGVDIFNSSTGTVTETLVNGHLHLLVSTAIAAATPTYKQFRLPVQTVTSGMMYCKFNIHTPGVISTDNPSVYNTIRLRVSNGTGGSAVGFNKYQSDTYLDYAEGNTAKHATTISLDEWHEIKMYFDSTSQTIVLDGNTIVNNAPISTISTTNNSMFAQSSNTTSDVEFYVDEFKLYNLGV